MLSRSQEHGFFYLALRAMFTACLELAVGPTCSSRHPTHATLPCPRPGAGTFGLQMCELGFAVRALVSLIPELRVLAGQALDGVAAQGQRQSAGRKLFLS